MIPKNAEKIKLNILIKKLIDKIWKPNIHLFAMTKIILDLGNTIVVLYIDQLIIFTFQAFYSILLCKKNVAINIKNYIRLFGYKSNDDYIYKVYKNIEKS